LLLPGRRELSVRRVAQRFHAPALLPARLSPCVQTATLRFESLIRENKVLLRKTS